jgi:SAM-dependent methyltransferase
MLVLSLRPARSKAREAGSAEAVALLRDLGAEAAPGGPLSEQKGIIWVTVPVEQLPSAFPRLSRLGYAESVDLLVPEEESARYPEESVERSVRWRRRQYRLLRVHQEDPAMLREQAPDRREFLLETSDHQVRAVRGYRGSEGPLMHRALPVPDARLLANLVWTEPPGLLLDPFAGAGGVAIEALSAGWRVLTIDADRSLRHGLAHLGAHHVIADARHVPLAAGCVDAVATEPPYESRTGQLVADALAEAGRVVRPGGRIAMLCARWQTPLLVERSAALGLTIELETSIDRKGVEVSAVLWRR